MYRPHIDPSVNGHVGCPHLLATVNATVINLGAQTSVPVPAFSAFEYIPGNGTAGSNGKSVII